MRLICSHHSVTKVENVILEAYRAMHDRTGDLPPLRGIFPDQRAPVPDCEGDTPHWMAAIHPTQP